MINIIDKYLRIDIIYNLIKDNNCDTISYNINQYINQHTDDIINYFKSQRNSEKNQEVQKFIDNYKQNYLQDGIDNILEFLKSKNFIKLSAKEKYSYIDIITDILKKEFIYLYKNIGIAYITDESKYQFICNNYACPVCKYFSKQNNIPLNIIKEHFKTDICSSYIEEYNKNNLIVETTTLFIGTNIINNFPIYFVNTLKSFLSMFGYMSSDKIKKYKQIHIQFDNKENIYRQDGNNIYIYFNINNVRQLIFRALFDIDKINKDLFADYFNKLFEKNIKLNIVSDNIDDFIIEVMYKYIFISTAIKDSELYNICERAAKSK